MNVKNLLSRATEKTAVETLEAWRQELWEALPGIFSDEEDRYGINDEGNVAIKKGGATLFVDFGLDEENDVGWVLAYSPLVHLPEEDLLPFYRKLLDINYDESVVGRLSTHDDTVFLAKSLTTEGCSVRAFILMVAELAGEADGIAEYLVKEFGARSTGIDVIAA
jgi:hypothetical protein